MYLLTRPKPKLNASVEYFAHAGVDLVGWSAVDIRFTDNYHQALANLALRPPDTLVVTSTFAAQGLVQWLVIDDHLARLSSTRIFAIGRSSAEILRPYFNRVYVPDVHTSEGLVASPHFTVSADSRCAVVKGRGGRNYIHQYVTQQQGHCEHLDIYYRQSITPISTIDWNWSDIKGIIVTSMEMAQALINHYDVEQLQTRPWLCVSERVANGINQQLACNISVCANASNSALLGWVQQNWE